MNIDKHGWGKIFEGRARHSVRAEVYIRTSGGQRIARPTNQSIFHPCSSVSIRGYFIFFVS